MGFGIRRRANTRLRRFALEHTWFLRAWMFLSPSLPYPGARVTPKRLANLYRCRWEMGRLRTVVRSRPLKLVVEPINVCNLRCPACFTGAGERDRSRKAIPLDVYRRLLREVGDYLWQIEFCNWGEPLLNHQLTTMVREAADKGIGTVVNTNFSVPFDDLRAEALVASGLTTLGVSIDGTRQETYEQYRVGGDLATVLENCRRVRDAKRRSGRSSPTVVWSFHTFPHNVADLDEIHARAAELDMVPWIEKGWVVGDEWDSSGRAVRFNCDVRPFPCLFLWSTGVVNVDGGVSPCCGTFYREDDMGRLETSPGDGGAASFREVWNGPRYREARAMYRNRAGSHAKDHVCHDCPTTITWERWQAHRAAGGTHQTFDPEFTSNDSFNYFWNRRRADVAPPRRRPMFGTR